MTVPELITRVLASLETQFYCDLPRRDFCRDQRYLVAAIGTYGWECHQRGWEFEVDFLYGELCRLLTSFKRAGTEITYMPIYLQTAIKQHIREHAEELKPQARQVKAKVRKVYDGLELAAVVREPSATQILASVYQDVRKLRKQAGAERRQKTAEEKKQQVLL
jgi:hypothetical protein